MCILSYLGNRIYLFCKYICYSYQTYRMHVYSKLCTYMHTLLHWGAKRDEYSFVQ